MGCLMPLALTVLAVMLGWHFWVRSFREGAIPAEIGLAGDFQRGEYQGEIIAPCGIFSFKMTSETIENIRKNGLHFFVSADRSRKEFLYFRDWRESPVIYRGRSKLSQKYDDYISEYISSRCSHGFDPLVREKIVAALGRPGSYYSIDLGFQLFVLPDMGLVVGTWQD
jgi:hypothetical protein